MQTQINCFDTPPTSLTESFEETPLPKTDEGLIRFFNQFRIPFSLDTAPFDPKDDQLGIEIYKTGACIGYTYLKTVEEKTWRDELVEQTYCYQSKCFTEKADIKHFIGKVCDI